MQYRVLLNFVGWYHLDIYLILSDLIWLFVAKVAVVRYIYHAERCYKTLPANAYAYRKMLHLLLVFTLRPELRGRNLLGVGLEVERLRFVAGHRFLAL